MKRVSYKDCTMKSFFFLKKLLYSKLFCDSKKVQNV